MSNLDVKTTLSAAQFSEKVLDKFAFKNALAIAMDDGRLLSFSRAREQEMNQAHSSGYQVIKDFDTGLCADGFLYEVVSIYQVENKWHAYMQVWSWPEMFRQSQILTYFPNAYEFETDDPDRADFDMEDDEWEKFETKEAEDPQITSFCVSWEELTAKFPGFDPARLFWEEIEFDATDLSQEVE